MLWFGQPFGLMCRDAEQVPIPIGRACDWCQEAIEGDDSGAVIPYLNVDTRKAESSFYHHQCLFRQINGSLGHLKQECSCYGDTDLSEIGFTKREAAIRAFNYAMANLRNKETVH